MPVRHVEGRRYQIGYTINRDPVTDPKGTNANLRRDEAHDLLVALGGELKDESVYAFLPDSISPLKVWSQLMKIIDPDLDELFIDKTENLLTNVPTKKRSGGGKSGTKTNLSMKLLNISKS